MRETLNKLWPPLLLMVVVLGLHSCSQPAAKSALDVILPIATDALTALIQDRFGTGIDESTAGCWDNIMPADEDEDGYVWILCRAKPIQ
jgi:hypothetical protein